MPVISLPVFQGPLDLLLQLIQREDLDITAVSLVAVADQYLEAVHTAEGLDAHALAEFVSIGAKLLHLKSRALLPRQEALDDEGEELEEDAIGLELVELLREYQRFREVAEMLGERQDAGLRTYPRGAPAPEPPEGSPLEGVTIDALYAVMLDVLSRTPPEEPLGVVRRHDVTIAQQTAWLKAKLARGRSFSFRRAIESCRSRMEVIVTFLALLELLKSGTCDVVQETPWGDIEVVAVGRVSR